MYCRVIRLCLCLAWPCAALADMRLKVLTFNIWGGGLHVGEALDATIAVLRAADADIVALQEAQRHGGPDCSPPASGDRGIARDIGRALGLHVHAQSGPEVRGVTAVLSRHPIAGATESGLGVRIDVGGRMLTLFNLHLEDAPYQPYQLMRIPYDEAPFLATEAEAVAAAELARGRTIDRLERELAGLGESAVIIAGDFNEPSFRDWTARAAAARRHPIPAAWPATRRIEALGFTDAYRAVFPDEMARPGFTWAVLPGEREHHDRIDFIFARGPGLRVEAAGVVGEASRDADIVVTPWPSDHRAVLAVLRFGTGRPQRQLQEPPTPPKLRRAKPSALVRSEKRASWQAP
jgi:exodeoxyribonuclease III